MKFKNSRKIKNIMKGVVAIFSNYPNSICHPSYFAYLASHKVGIHFTYSNGGTCTEEQLSENGKVLGTYYPLNTSVYCKAKDMYWSYC